MIHCKKDERKNDPVVAEVDGIPIYSSTFSRALLDRLKWSPVQIQDTPELRRQIVKELAGHHFFAARAEQANLHLRPEFRQAMQAESTVVILHGLWQEEIGKTLTPESIPEQEVEDAYKKMATKFHLRHLFARTKNEIDSLYTRLQNGESFSTLAHACFRDSVLKENAGDLGTLSWGDLDDLRLEEAVFHLAVGQYSPPVESVNGWHILFLENLIYNPLLSEQDYLLHRESIRRRICRRRLVQQSEERIKQLMQSKDIRMNVPLIIELEKTQRRLKNNGMVQISDITQVADSPLEQMLDRRLDAVLASYDGQPWTVADFRRTLHTVSPEILQRGLYRSVAVSLRNHFLLDLAKQKRIAQLPSVRHEVADKRQHLLSALYLSVYADTCTFDESDYRQFYLENQHQFLLDREMKVYEILLPSEKEAYRIRSMINTEKDFHDMARQHTVRPGMREREGFLGTLTRRDYEGIGEAAFRLKPGSVRGPVLACRDGYSLLMVTESRDLFRPFDQVQDTLRQALMAQKRVWAWKKLLADFVPDEKIKSKKNLDDSSLGF